MENERDIVKKIRIFIDNPEQCEDGIVDYFAHNIKYITYETMLAQKIMLKLYLSEAIEEIEKETIYNNVMMYYNTEQIRTYIDFIKIIFPVLNKLQNYIGRQIQDNFNSLFVFLSCLSMFTMENPDIIKYPKNLLMQLAAKLLPYDTSWREAQSKIVLAEDTYIKHKRLIENIYLKAISYGCIIEKFDDISYLKEEVLEVKKISTRPVIKLQMSDPEYKYRIMLGSAYYGEVSNRRIIDEDWNNDLIYQFYKCFICKKSYFYEIGDLEKEWILGMLRRQFMGENMLDLIIRVTGQTGSIVVSILLYLYIKQLFLIMVHSQMYQIITYEEISKEICFADKINCDEFSTIYFMIFTKEDLEFNFFQHPFFREGNNIIIARWMFDQNYNVFEEPRNIILNPYTHNNMGREMDYFGKHIFEKFIKDVTKDCGWKVLKTGIKVKRTDFDLVAFKDGRVILAQVKVAHCGREPYQLWKADKIIEKAVDQINVCRRAIQEDKFLLYSNLKREGIVTNGDQIQDILYLIIIGNSYFAKRRDIPVISIEDLKNVLMIEQEDNARFKEILNDALSMYNIREKPIYKSSLIDTDEYSILYDEYEI